MPKRRRVAPAVEAKMRENRVREKAARWGLRLTRSRQRDGLLAGTYGLIDDAADKWALAGPQGEYGKSLDEVEAFLQTDLKRAGAA